VHGLFNLVNLLVNQGKALQMGFTLSLHKSFNLVQLLLQLLQRLHCALSGVPSPLNLFAQSRINLDHLLG
jgi:hypothetical protein